MSGRSSAARSVSIAAVAAAFVLVLMGALVTSNEAGDSVPDWPLAWGQVLPVSHLSGKVVFEFSHRAIAGIVVILTAVLVVLVLARQRRPLPVGLSLAALGVVIVQALLGGLRVRLGETHSYGVATVHAFTAQVFLGVLCSLLAALSAPEQPVGTGRSPLRGLAIAAAFAVPLQTLLGAADRHRVIGVLPHVLGAAVVAGLIVATALVLRARIRSAASGFDRRALTLYRLAVGALVLQALLGAAIYLLLRGQGETTGVAATTVVVAVLHLGLGSALIFLTVTGAFAVSRLAGQPAAAGSSG